MSQNRASNDTTTDISLAVLTRADSSFGYQFLKRLSLKGIKPAVLCIEDTPFAKRVKMAKFLAKKIGWLDAVRYNAKFWYPILQRKIGYGKPLPNFDDFAEKVVICRDINSPCVVDVLAQDKIKKVILAQSGIIKPAILELNKVIINCHPGKLPDLRGVDVIRWALLKRQPIEVTLHLVDAGIDTGAVLQRMCIAILPDDTVESVIDRTISQSIDMLVEATIKNISDYPPPIIQDKNYGKQYYLMPFNLVFQLEQEWQDIMLAYALRARFANSR